MNNAKPNAEIYLPYFIRISPYPDPDPDQIRGSVDLGPPAAGSGNIAYNRALYAIVQAGKHWRRYLVGKETMIFSDHQPLQFLKILSKM